MTKELQDLAWSVLPKEFKEEVKETYREYTEKIATKSGPEYRIVGYIAAQTELELLFGEHNLTSDADGEEMLMCEKSKVVKLYNKFQKDGTFVSLYAAGVLDTLFGSECLLVEKDLETHQSN